MFDPGLIDLVMFLRQKGISDTRILEAFETVPRRYFVAPSLQSEAYANRPLPIACGQTLPAPLTLAMIAHFADLKPEHKILLVGTGSGYFAALLSKLVRRVYTLERYKTLCKSAEQRLSQLDITNIVIDHRDGLKGWAGQAPYDRIILVGAVDKRPKALEAQISKDGALFYVCDQQLMKYKCGGGTAQICTALDLSLIHISEPTRPY